MSDLYQAAWEYGVKTTYYLHVKPRHGAEQSTTKVNKAKSINAGSSGSNGRRGFGGFAKAPQASAPEQTNGVTPSTAKGFGTALNVNATPTLPPVTATDLESETDVVDGVQC